MQKLVANVFQFIGLMILLSIPPSFLFGFMTYNQNHVVSDGVLHLQTLLFMVLVVGLIWGVYVIYRNTLPENSYFHKLGFKIPFQAAHLCLCVPYVMVMLSLGWFHITLVEWVTGEVMENGLETVNQLIIMQLVANLPMFMMVVDIVLFAPIFEELVFRGIFFHYFNTKNFGSRLTALLISAMTFAAAHTGGELNLDGLVYLGMGLTLGTVYLHTRDLRYPILVHIVNNAVAVSQLYEWI
ncbi:MAG: CPBP family intramembrane metalloprotease [Alysiella sp.]|uniref:CPBP family intramembrane glutamic endopeptidase n=1 Tax=Alysiella sp. TaxID=1872483 RepID=UPI0026DDA8DC|nr:CPBP family intramembrane glutamic endopeptidase [Alysiella sp.]MDO4433805.1 CPBP family intramembrane metalloprotease [Alysiella sp.]